MSEGPFIEEGKQSSSMNGIKTGFTTEALLLPGETLEGYESTVRCWMQSLRPATPAEARIAARIGDLDFRLVRLNRVEHRQTLAALEVELKATEVHKQLAGARETFLGVKALAGITNDIELTEDTAPLEDVLPAIREVVEQVAKSGLSMELADSLHTCMKEVILDDALGDLRAAWKRLAAKSREVEERFAELLTELEQKVESERGRLLEEQALGNDKEMQRIARYRRGLQSDMDQALATYKTTRELAQGAPPQGDGEACGPVIVELRMVGTMSARPASTATRRS